MGVNVRGRNYLKLLDYTSEEIRYLLDLAKDFKSMKRAGVEHKYLSNKNIVLLFEKTSTRTRCAFEVAGHDLGLGVTCLLYTSRCVSETDAAVFPMVFHLRLVLYFFRSFTEKPIFLRISALETLRLFSLPWRRPLLGF